MKLMKKDFKPNEIITTYFAMESMSLRKNKTQQNFLVLDLYDKTWKIKGYLWNDPVVMAATLTERSFVKAMGITKLLNEALVIEVERIRKAEKNEIDMRDFLEVVAGGVELWQRKLLEYFNIIKDVNCRRLIDLFLKDENFMEQFMASLGGVSVHHNYVGGLIEHTVNIMTQAALTADKNSGLLDKDLLLTGAFIHDIGKTREIYWEIAKEYTTEGKLLGHIGIGLLMLDEKLSGIKSFPKDLSMLLKHMILSHHGEMEYGSPVRPATPEAVALHLIDNNDAKINHLYCHLGNSNQDNQWSHFDRILNTEIYQKKFSKEILKELKGKAA